MRRVIASLVLAAAAAGPQEQSRTQTETIVFVALASVGHHVPRHLIVRAAGSIAAEPAGY
jgi:hypothetical protein